MILRIFQLFITIRVQLFGVSLPFAEWLREAAAMNQVILWSSAYATDEGDKQVR